MITDGFVVSISRTQFLIIPPFRRSVMHCPVGDACIAVRGRFRDSDLFRHLFEIVLTRCIAEGLVGGEAFGVDASIVQADAKQLNKVEAAGWTPERITRATDEYFETLEDEAFGAATPVKPKVLSPVDPAARFTGAEKAYLIFVYSTNRIVLT